MNTFGGTKSKINPRNILGDDFGFFEDFEMEATASSVTQAVGGVLETEKFPTTGTIEFKKKLEHDQKDRAEANRIRKFNQILKEDYERTQRAKDNLLFEEELNDITINLPTEEKNKLLHLQASYRGAKSAYHRAELRRELINQRKKSEEQEKQVSIPSPAKQPSALEGAFEGRSGTQGSGTANLSAHATG